MSWFDLLVGFVVGLNLVVSTISFLFSILVSFGEDKNAIAKWVFFLYGSFSLLLIPAVIYIASN